MKKLTLPVLPTRDVAISPWEGLHLFVGREKSLAAIAAAMAGDKQLALIAQTDPRAAEIASAAQLSDTGVLATIVTLVRLPDGTAKVALQASERVRLDALVGYSPALTAELTVLPTAKPVAAAEAPVDVDAAWRQLAAAPVGNPRGAALDELLLRHTRALTQWAANNLSSPPKWGPPVAEGQLRAFEVAIGRRLPEDLRRFYALQDGQEESGRPGLVYDLPFQPLATVLHDWRLWAEIAAGWSDNELEACMSGKKVRPVYAHAGWIGFAGDGNGNHLGVDLDPDAEGSYGQVINFGRNEQEKYVLAASFSDFLGWLTAQLAAGNFVIADEDAEFGPSLHLRNPESTNFFQALPQLFA